VTILLTLIFLAVLLRTAWISDDALITLRSVLNVTHGFGLTFNIAERVQTFTHPLWMMLLTGVYLLVGNVYIATFALSIATSVLVFWIALRRAVSPAQLAIVAVVLLSSRAFVDFSTSGLENPLANLLIAMFTIAAARAARGADGIAVDRSGLVRLWLLGSLLYLTRPDDVLLVAPALVVFTVRARAWRSSWRAVAIGLSPAIAWSLFALLYYGFVFPNTAVAKLATGIRRAELWHQGVLYMLDSLDRDPVTLVTIALAIVVAVRSRGVGRQLAAGLILYLLYVVSIGGDFMAGRFLATPLFASALLVGWLIAVETRTAAVAAGALALVGLASPQIPLLSDSRFDEPGVKTNGVVDERAVYFRDRSLVKSNRQSFVQPDWPRAIDPAPPIRHEDSCGLLGIAGLDFGPYAHLLDECALADPLLARLPAVFNTGWRPGHFRRMIPDGYRESLKTSTNALTDKALRPLYDDLMIVTRSPGLLSRDRLRAIWRLNTGRQRNAFDWRFYRHGGSIVALEALSAPKPDETAWDAPGTFVLQRPLAVTCEDRPGRRYLDASLDSNDRYVFVFVKRNRVVAELEVGPIPEHRRRPGLAWYSLNVPGRATREGFDTIVVAGGGGDELYSIGHLLLDGHATTQDELDRRVRERDRPSTQ